MGQKQTARGQAVFLAAGGTGGHLFPAEALARALSARGFVPHLLTDSRARRFVNTGEDGFSAANVHVLDSAPIVLKKPLAAVKNVCLLLRGFWQALRLMRRFRPALLVGFGGYPTLPPLYAARFCGAPIFLHEQNAVMGRANRLAARFAKAVALGFPPAAGAPGGALRAKLHLTGNPLRAAVLRAAQTAYHPAGENEPFVLLIFGGSQGASFFAEIMPQALRLLPAELRARLKLIQQARAGDEAALRAAYRQLGVKAELAVFFKDLPALMARAQFVIARSGASTVAEIAAVGRPCLLVPYPKALDGDQKYNAEALAAAGGAETAEQSALSAAKLAAIITEAMRRPQDLSQKAQAARAAGKTDAAERLADLAQAQMKRRR